LSPTQRLAVIMYYYDDLPLRKIAQRLSCSEGNIKRHLVDARARLKSFSSGNTEVSP
jgi:RNA polymerase sigma factor (sigma-70 family)